MKGTGLTEFQVGTPRPKINVSATLHYSAFDLASWDDMSLPFNAPIWMNFEALEPINIIHKGGKTMIAVGIDVSKSKSTIAILNSDGE